MYSLYFDLVLAVLNLDLLYPLNKDWELNKALLGLIFY